MRQVNVVGAGPFSPSSRVIQTLQAPPDVAPAGVTVRTASETSLRLRWVVSGEAGGPRARSALPGAQENPEPGQFSAPPLCRRGRSHPECGLPVGGRAQSRPAPPPDQARPSRAPRH